MTVSDLVFIKEELINGNTCWRAPLDGCQFSVLDRMTGWGGGIRDTETGFRDRDNNFWLVSGMFDIRDYADLSIKDAITKIKDSANTCRGKA